MSARRAGEVMSLFLLQAVSQTWTISALSLGLMHGAPVRRQGGGADQGIVVGVEQQDRLGAWGSWVRWPCNEHAILQLALPLDPARDHHALADAVIVLGKHAP